MASYTLTYPPKSEYFSNVIFLKDRLDDYNSNYMRFLKNIKQKSKKNQKWCIFLYIFFQKKIFEKKKFSIFFILLFFYDLDLFQVFS